MKKSLITLLVVFIYCSLNGQDMKLISGDWMRIKAEFTDGQRIPRNHEANTLIRYHFTSKEVFNVFPGQTYSMPYTRTNNTLKIGPALKYSIEKYTDKAFTLVEEGEDRPIRYYLIPTDSFQIMGLIKYKYEVVETDTIYTTAPGIEPIFPEGQNEFMKSIIMGFSGKVGFKFTYVVQKDGTIGDVSVISSSNTKQNKRLIKLVEKTSGQWIPASYKGKPIHVRQEATISVQNSPSGY